MRARQVFGWLKREADGHPKVNLVFFGLMAIYLALVAIGQLLIGAWWWTILDGLFAVFYAHLAQTNYNRLRQPQAEPILGPEGVLTGTYPADWDRIIRERWERSPAYRGLLQDDVIMRAGLLTPRPISADQCADSDTLTVDHIRAARDRLRNTQINQSDYGHLQCHAATGRAWATLYSYLSEAEQNQLAEHGYFEVPSKLTAGRVYRIPATEGMATVLDDGKQVMRICVRPEDTSLPWPDVMLAYKLGLQADEATWLATANKWGEETVLRPLAHRIIQRGLIDRDQALAALETAAFMVPPLPRVPETRPNDVNITLDDSGGFATVTIPRGTSFSANFSWAGDSLDVSDVVIAWERMPYFADVCMEEIAPDDFTPDVPGTEASESFTLTPTVSAVQNFITPTIAERIRQTEQGPVHD